MAECQVDHQKLSIEGQVSGLGWPQLLAEGQRPPPQLFPAATGLPDGEFDPLATMQCAGQREEDAGRAMDESPLEVYQFKE
jgi:hypothetical protein